MNNKITLLNFVVVISSQIECNRKLRIVSGLDADISKFPYVVSLHYQWEVSSTCSGSIIGGREILTAANCVEMKDDQYYVRVGSNFADRGGYNYEVRKIIGHPNYNRKPANLASDNDIAVLILNKSIAFSERVAAITLPEQQERIDSNSKFLVSGWGDTRSKKDFAPNLHLKSAENVAVPVSKCMHKYKSRNFTVTDNMICGYTDSDDLCYEDSGAPAVLNGKLVGIVSGGERCANKKYPGIYTRVSAFVDWIKSTVRNQ